MAWTCPDCSRDGIEDSASACPKCGLKKAVWTVHEDKTRLMKVVVARERFAVHAGIGGAPLEASARDAHPDDEQAQVAWSLPRAQALDLARRGLRPAPAHQLVVRAFGKGKPSALHVAVLLAHGETTDHAIAARDAVEGGVDAARLVLVHGPGEAVTFPGLHVLDVSEDDGVAPRIAVRALKQKAKELPVRAVLPAARLTIRDDLRRTGRSEIDQGKTVVLRAELEPEVPGEYRWEVAPEDCSRIATVLFAGAEARVTGLQDDVIKLTCRFREADGQVRHAEHRVEIGRLRPIHLRLQDVGGRPMAGAWCRIETPVDGFEGKADERGCAVVRIPPALTSATLIVAQGDGPRSALKVTIGPLCAPETPEGAQQRLNNLGYAAGQDGDAAALDGALARFRAHNAIAPPATRGALLDEPTRARLEDAHDRRDGALVAQGAAR